MILIFGAKAMALLPDTSASMRGQIIGRWKKGMSYMGRSRIRAITGQELEPDHSRRDRRVSVRRCLGTQGNMGNGPLSRVIEIGEGSFTLSISTFPRQEDL